VKSRKKAKSEENTSPVEEWGKVSDNSPAVSSFNLKIIANAPEEALEAIRSSDSPAVTADDVAYRLGVSVSATRGVLESLRADGMLESRISGDTRLWWIPENDSISPDPPEESDIPDLPSNLISSLEEVRLEGESLAEVYIREKGTPGPELLKNVLGGSSTEVIGEIRKSISERRNSDEGKFDAADRLG
jgi:predicted DNA-binding protein (UPF0251 family)